MNQGDIASLTFQIDSTQAQSATQRLDAMRESAVSAALAMQGLGGGSGEATRNFATFGNRIAEIASRMQSMDTSLQAVVNRMTAMRSLMEGSNRLAGGFMAIREQSDALAHSIGSTTNAMEGWVRQSQQMMLTSAQTTAALERVTAAITQQTAAGRQLRTIMQDYGVQFHGTSNPNAAPQVLAQFVHRMEGYRQTERTAGVLQEVIGPLNLQDMATLANPPYFSPWQQRVMNFRRRQQITEASLFHNASAARHYGDIEAQRWSYFEDRYNLGMPTMDLLGGVPNATIAWALRRMGRTVGPGADARMLVHGAFQQEAVMREIDRYGSLQQREGAGMNPMIGPFATSPLGRFLAHYGGEQHAFEQNINARTRLAEQNATTTSGWFGAMFRGIGWRAENLLDLYTPHRIAVPNAARNPMGEVQDEHARALALMQFGLAGPNTVAQTQRELLNLHKGSAIAYTPAQMAALRATGRPLGAFGQMTPQEAGAFLRSSSRNFNLPNTGQPFNLPAEESALLIQSENMGNIGPRLLGLPLAQFMQVGSAAAPGNHALAGTSRYLIDHHLRTMADVRGAAGDHPGAYGGMLTAMVASGTLAARRALSHRAIAAEMPKPLVELLHYYAQPDVVSALGLRPGEAGPAAGVTFANLIGQAQIAQIAGANPSYGQLLATQVQGWAGHQPAAQRAEAMMLWQFAQRNGIDTRSWASSGLGVGGILSPMHVGAGALTAPQQRTFAGIWHGVQANQITAISNAMRQNIAAQEHVQTAISQGSGAVEIATARWSAYAEAINSGKSGLEAAAQANAAANQAISRNTTLLDQSIERQREQNHQTQIQLHLMDLAGTNPTAMSAAGFAGTVQAGDYAFRLSTSGSPFQRDILTALHDAQVRGGMGKQAQLSGAALVQNYSLEAHQQHQLADATRERTSAQAQLNRELEVERQFQRALGEAYASGNSGAVNQVEQQVQAAIRLANAMADATRQVQNYSSARHAMIQGAAGRYEATLPSGAAVARFRTALGVITEPQNLGNPHLFPGAFNFLGRTIAHRAAPFTGAIDAAAARAAAPPELLMGYFANESSMLANPPPGVGGASHVGIAQMDAPTARLAGLTVSHMVDQRLDPTASIAATGRLLRQRWHAHHFTPNWNHFPDWLRAIQMGTGEPLLPQNVGTYRKAFNEYEAAHGTAVSLAAHPAALAHLSPSLAHSVQAAQYERTGVNQATNAQQDREFHTQMGQMVARLHAAASGPAAQALAAAGVVNQALPANAAQDAARRLALTRAEQRVAGATAVSQLDFQARQGAAVLHATLAGPGYQAVTQAQTEGAQIARASGGGTATASAAASAALVQHVLQQFTSLGAEAQHAALALADLRREGHAWKGGPTAARAAQMSAPYHEQMQAVRQAEQLLPANSPARAAIASLMQEVARRNIPGQNLALAQGQAGLDYQQQKYQIGVQARFLNADTAAGIFATPYQAAYAHDKVQGQLIAQNTGSASAGSHYDQMMKQIEALKMMNDEVRSVRASFSSMGNTIMGAFEVGITRANNFQAAMRQATLSVESQALQTLVNKPILNLAQGALSTVGNSVWGAISGLFGQSSSGSPSTTVTPTGGSSVGSAVASSAGNAIGTSLVGSAVSWLGGLLHFASGGVIEGGTPSFNGGGPSSFQGGGIIDRPTLLTSRYAPASFSYAATGAVMAGEVGHEAVLPLRRMANGNLGVASSGGSGPSVQINAPISVGSSAGGKGGGGHIDPAAMKMIQSQFENMFRSGVKNVLVSEQRPGGALYAGINMPNSGYQVA